MLPTVGSCEYVGRYDGFPVVGRKVGAADVGGTLGTFDVGDTDGLCVGFTVGSCVGYGVGKGKCVFVGRWVGPNDGLSVSIEEGVTDGVADGFVVPSSSPARCLPASIFSFL